VAKQKMLLQKEGHKVKAKGKNRVIVDYDKKLAAL
jgi:hypothetical protein